MGAPKGNQNAAKPAMERATAKSYVYSTSEERRAWLKKAGKASKSLSDWAKEKLNEAH